MRRGCNVDIGMPRLNQNAAWLKFVDWCKTRGLKPLPANPWTVAAYARWCETRHRYNTIVTFIKAIAKMHGLKSRKRPDRHPTVMETLSLIKERQSTREQERARAAALFRAEDFAGEPVEAAVASATLEQAGPKTGAGTKAKEGAKAGAAALKRALRSTPKLVSRRPSLT